MTSGQQLFSGGQKQTERTHFDFDEIAAHLPLRSDATPSECRRTLPTSSLTTSLLSNTLLLGHVALLQILGKLLHRLAERLKIFDFEKTFHAPLKPASHRIFQVFRAASPKVSAPFSTQTSAKRPAALPFRSATVRPLYRYLMSAFFRIGKILHRRTDGGLWSQTARSGRRCRAEPHTATFPTRRPPYPRRASREIVPADFERAHSPLRRTVSGFRRFRGMARLDAVFCLRTPPKRF